MQHLFNDSFNVNDDSIVVTFKTLMYAQPPDAERDAQRQEDPAWRDVMAFAKSGGDFTSKCILCQDSFKSHEVLRFKCSCSHYTHVRCFEQWSAQNGKPDGGEGEENQSGRNNLECACCCITSELQSKMFSIALSMNNLPR